MKGQEARKVALIKGGGVPKLLVSLTSSGMHSMRTYPRHQQLAMQVKLVEATYRQGQTRHKYQCCWTFQQIASFGTDDKLLPT
jgi:hypothetical protein